MFFINCLCKTYKYDKPIYLGGSTPDDLYLVISESLAKFLVPAGLQNVTMEKVIKGFCSNAIQIESCIIVAATDTDIFSTLLSHYQQCIHED